MRIIAGELRGRSITAPQGMGTRPTTDRVRESIMSMVYSARDGFEGAAVLDAFAGSGALGLEAISRGADRAVFCDSDAGALRTVQANVKACGLGAERARTVSGDALASVPRLARFGPFDLVFLDPPYACDPADIMGMVQRLDREGCLCPDALVVYEHGISDGRSALAAAEAAGFRARKNKKFGETAVDLLVRE